MASINFDTFFNSLNRKLEPSVKSHLKNVYLCMAMGLLSASIGSCVHLYTDFMSGGFFSFLMTLGFGIALMSTPDTGKNRNKRLIYLNGLAFSSGLSLGPLLNLAIMVNPSIIPMAFVSTCIIFASFSLSAVFSDHRKWLYLGGTLMSFLSLLLFVSIINLFIASKLLFQIHLYLSFFVICGFIMYDTSLIIEKRKMGDDDYIWHAVLLFIDFLDVFRYILVILMQKEERNSRRKK
ncbi:bax-mediated apoptosis inhibitor-like protein [Leptotrombidium deliense]|uniref:Bax-mediated apoptosis inhibitor-like protein n=1 Tax=Leptotrombidium deliense TaxID=299467 RepID=A0A443SPC0_9ACAR|nr:bax-mediated apoptosis inhibitor-like protein [Leptotrombidium deliense]